MIGVTERLPAVSTDRPPIILVHGAANSALVWTYWQQALADAGWASYAIDLRGHGTSPPLDLSRTSMRHYAADVVSLAGRLARPPIILGWSMGGLVGMMACEASRLLLRAWGWRRSTPARSRGPGRYGCASGVFTAEEYGITSDDPDEQPAMPDLDREERSIALASLGSESRFARDERQRGIVIESLPCPLLIVTGTDDQQWPRERYDDLQLPAGTRQH